MNVIKYLFIAIVFTLVSCTGKINRNNYDKISTGMRVSEVEAILGKGSSQASSKIDLGWYNGSIDTEIITWEQGGNVISIQFSNGKVQAKSQFGL